MEWQGTLASTNVVSAKACFTANQTLKHSNVLVRRGPTDVKAKTRLVSSLENGACSHPSFTCKVGLG